MMSQVNIWNRFARGYAKRPVADPESYQIKLDKSKALLSASAHIYEVGCGTGSTALWHAPHVASVEATDFSPRMIEIAQAKAAGVDNVTFRVAGVMDPPSRRDYDAVLIMSVLHLLPDPGAALRHLAGLLKPGGYLMSSTVCVGEMGGILPRLLPLLGKTRLIPTVKVLDKSNLIALHQAAGLTIREEFQPGPGKAVFLIAQA